MGFDRKERGIDRPLTRDSLVDEAARVRAVLALRDKFRADVDGLIRLGRRLHKEFVASATGLPLVKRAAATELMRVYTTLEEFESSLPRGPGGILMQNDALNPTQPVRWPGRPRSLQAIAPFSEQNVREWRLAAGEPGPPLPARPPSARPVVKAPPKVPRKAPAADHISASLIKVPGISLASPAGRTRMLTNVLRVLSHQALSDEGAREVAARIDILKYLVLGFEETIAHKTRALEQLPVGHEYSVRLRKEFLADAQKATPVRLDANQRMNLDLGNGFSSLHRPDNSHDERFWYALQRMQGRTRNRDSGYMPGQIVSNDGIMFVGPDVGGSLFLAPDGRLYLVKQRSLRDQQLEAFRIGVVNAAGGVMLGWAVVVVGVSAIYAPAAAAAAANWIGGTLGVTSTTGLYNSIMASRFTWWLGMHWPAVVAEGTFYVGLGSWAITFDPRAFVRQFKDDPKGALLNLIQSLAELGQGYGEARMAGVPSTRGRAPRASAPDPEPPAVPVTPRALPPAADQGPVAPAAPVPVAPASRPVQEPASSADTAVLKRMIGEALQKSGKPANSDRMTNPSSSSQAGEMADEELAPALVLQRTGTDAPASVIGDQTTGITMSSRTKSIGPTPPKHGSVVSSSGTQRAPGRRRQPPAGDDPDEGRGIAAGSKPVLYARRPWKPVTPPPHPQYSNPRASVAERLRFIATANLALRKSKDQGLSDRQVKQLVEWSQALRRGQIREAKILKPRRKGQITLSGMERTIDEGLKEQFRHRLARATGVTVLSITRSDNVGDRAADFYAQLAGRPRAYSFETQTADGRRVQIDDFDFNTGQFIESKSLTELVPANAPRELKLREYREQMEKGAIAARDNGIGSIKWLVPPDVDFDLVDHVYAHLPPAIRKHVHIPTKPAPPIR